MSAAAQEAASAVAQDVIAEIEATQPDVLEPAPAGEETVTEAAVAAPVFATEFPEDVQALLDEDDPDDEEDDDLPPAAETTSEWDDTGYADPEADRLRAENHKLTKQLEHQKGEALKVQRKEWAVEVTNVFPLLTTEEAQSLVGQADSRRSALRAAKGRYDVLAAGAQRVAEHYEQNIDRIVAERVAAAEARVAEQWGSPIGGPGPVPVEAAERAEEEAEIQRQIANAPTLLARTALKIKHNKI